ncbi:MULTISPECIES: hypothetical protein [Pseudanabaena]|uniref:Uncharacterized protein n=2 Tax=Pseudanabaena TaxID=1152 RepID=L8MYX7_9CYAN|nr:MULTISPECIES: hypothetical protein [Pseudanabaena]ELS33187.1 hypothetical protein Pse7429DRAFT_1787 [Pseudanabaena biceps PCC 7429]MDG3494617.1 hypothetical protein [Pseudanabaena catenata USMAC16]
MQRRHLYILSVCATVCLFGLEVKSAKIFNSRTDKIPSPAEMSQIADSLSPEEISQLEVDDVLRDRLRFDPQWQEIAQAIHQDIIQTKWGRDPVKNPAWKRYGAKAYPLLSYYASFGDETRQKYGIEGIRSLGKPYTTLWLQEQIKRRINYASGSELRRYFYNELLFDNGFWEMDFGLNNPKLKEEFIALAKANLGDKRSLEYYSQFNYDFLVSLLGNAYFDSEYDPHEYYKEKNFTDLSEWIKFEQLQQPTEKQINEAIAFYRKLSIDDREHILVERLGRIEAGKITPFGLDFFRALADEPATNEKAKDRIWAIAELDRHGDEQGSEILQGILDNDLIQLVYLTKVGDYDRSSSKEVHANFLILGIVEKYPQSKFVQGCREYGDLTGRSYFGRQKRNQEILDRNAKMTAQERVNAWQDWLNRHGDHLGADDASYHLAVSLQDNNDIVGAMRVWLRIMAQPMGDRDALYLAFPHIRTLLDVGLSIDQLQTLLQETENQSFAPLLQYVIAIQYARSQNYAKALEISANVQIETFSDRILDAYYYPRGRWQKRSSAKHDLVEIFKQEVQSMLSEQKLRWQKLHQWQIENTPESRYRIASDWAGKGGWKNGYLPIWNGRRVYALPTEEWDCKKWWVCDPTKRNNSEMLASYQGSSQNAIAISLYQQLLEDKSIPTAIREKTLYMVAMTLLNQLENHPLSETIRIHPPAGVLARQQLQHPHVDRGNYYANEEYKRIDESIRSDYQKRIDEIIAELQTKFPQSRYIGDLLFSSSFLSDQPHYLQTILERYPNSDRAAEAKFLLGLKKWQLVRETMLYMKPYF